jgi:hypothetical protein
MARRAATGGRSHGCGRGGAAGVTGGLMADLTEDETQKLVDALNRFEPKDVHVALDGIDEHPLRGPDRSHQRSGAREVETPGAEAGVLIYRGEDGLFHLRITVTEMTGAFYDELAMSGASLRGLGAALLATLEERHAPKDP